MLRRRRATAACAIFALITAGVAVGASKVAGANGDSPIWPPPTVPTQQPGLVLDCHAGQVDLNHASVAQLQALPSVSEPIAQRIIAQRPHDRTQDLLTVPGVGPDKLAAINASGLACSTPLTLPPPAADVCTSSNQLDVNDPTSLSGLAVLFGTPTAQRVVAAEPFPDLAHAKVVLAAGAGPGKLAKYVARLCETPVPKTSGGVNYSWVYSAAGGRADLNKFALVVPPHTLTDPVGQWLRITPQPTPTPDLQGPAWPSAEFAVLGAGWSDGTKRVYVTMPTDPELAEFDGTAGPIIAHWAGRDRSGGQIADTQVNGPDSTITAAVTHLSILDSISQGVSWLFEPIAGLLADARFPAPTCDGSWTLDPATGNWSKGSARVELTGALLNLPGNTVPPFGWPQKHCVESTSGGSDNVRLRIVNNTRTFESLTSYNGDTELGNVDPIGADPLQVLIIGAAQAILHHPVAYPGGEVSVTVPSGDRGAVRMTPNIPITATWAVVHETPLADLINDAGGSDPAVDQVFRTTIGCLLSGLNTLHSMDTSVGSELDALTGLAKSCIDYEGIRVRILEAEYNGRISPEKVGKIGVILNKLQRYVLWLKVGRVTVTGYDTWLGYAGDASAGIIDIENYAPKPTQDLNNRHLFDICVHQHGLIWTIDMTCQDAAYAGIGHVDYGSGGQNGLPHGKIARDPEGHAWFVNQDTGALDPIADGGTYLCLAKHYAVDWDANLGSYQDNGYAFAPTPMTCDASIPDDRPINDGNTGPDAIVLRQADGTAWVVWDGKREHIRSGADFECWVNPQYTTVIPTDLWDQVTDGQLNHWEIDTTMYVSNCGDPTHPGF